MDELTFGSLFAGIGGFDYGLERAGMRGLWQCEIDPYALRVLEKHWPDVLRVRDIRQLRARDVPAVDVLCGGFPCQDISLAGRGVGIDGARSGLWGEYARIVGELRPRYVIVENVPALAARGLGRVLGDLAALGYDAEWDCVSAQEVGAPHLRKRLWIVAYPGGEQHEGSPDALGWTAAEGLPETASADANGDELWKQQGRRGGEDRAYPALAPVDGAQRAMANTDRERHLQPEGCECHIAGRPAYCRGAHLPDTDELGCEERLQRPSGREQRPGTPDALGVGQHPAECALQPWRVGGRVAQAGGSGWWSVEPPMGRVAHGVPNRLDQLAALGNALVPQIAEWIGRRILEYERGRLAA